MRKQYSSQFKAEVVVEMLREEKTLAEIAAERHVHPTLLHRWRALALAELPEMFTRRERGRAERAEQDKKVHELYAEIGRLSTELERMK
jgi:putative transposase